VGCAIGWVVNKQWIIETIFNFSRALRLPVTSFVSASLKTGIYAMFSVKIVFFIAIQIKEPDGHRWRSNGSWTFLCKFI